jgi:omega-amidase
MPRTPPLRIAIAQLPMQWTGDANTAGILDVIDYAARSGAHICVFPELAVTGFHRQIAAVAKPESVDAWLLAIRKACASRCIAVSVGAPTFGDDGAKYDSQVFIDESGELVGVVEKTGLTPPEATFFARGNSRPVVKLQGRACTAVICREIEDLDEVCAQLASAESPELVFWPGLMRPSDDSACVEPPVHVQRAAQFATRLEAFVIQANWPNSLNYPEEGAKAGKSVVIAPSGEILLTRPQAEAGVAIFDLGEASYTWLSSQRHG